MNAVESYIRNVAEDTRDIKAAIGQIDQFLRASTLESSNLQIPL